MRRTHRLAGRDLPAWGRFRGQARCGRRVSAIQTSSVEMRSPRNAPSWCHDARICGPTRLSTDFSTESAGRAPSSVVATSTSPCSWSASTMRRWPRGESAASMPAEDVNARELACAIGSNSEYQEGSAGLPDKTRSRAASDSTTACRSDSAVDGPTRFRTMQLPWPSIAARTNSGSGRPTATGRPTVGSTGTSGAGLRSGSGGAARSSL